VLGSDNGWGIFYSPFNGDLSDKYLAGGIGTYSTTTPVPENSRKWSPVWTKKSNSSNTTRSNVGGGRNLNSADALKAYLDKQPANSPDKPIKVAMKANEMMLKSIAKVIMDAGKYVSLDLSGSPLKEIPDRAFINCKTLAGIIIPNGVTSIREDAFRSCTNLTKVTIPNTVTSIEGKHNWSTSTGAFIECTGLISITIPNSVTSIGDCAFDGCNSLTSVTFQGTITSNNFGHYTDITPFRGDLREKYLAGGIGTYTTTAPVSAYSKWTKQ
jgi:hypothetical protein